jgi:hypothetical protein
VLNSAYGKFALDPRRFANYYVTELDAAPKGNGWELEARVGHLQMWAKPNDKRFTGFINVATAASITGASRAQLWRGACKASNLAYCDTDSLTCGAFGGDVDRSKLGAWKHEQSGNKLAIGGKKLYALFQDGVCVKKASKGAKLSGEQIEAVARGETVTWTSDAPKLKLNGKHIFVQRDITITTASAMAEELED